MLNGSFTVIKFAAAAGSSIEGKEGQIMRENIRFYIILTGIRTYI